jgi:hypothetical protein
MEKMNVKLAVQVFSNSFSAAMKVLINNQSVKELDSSATGTQILLDHSNQLFDILNNNQTHQDKYLKFDSPTWHKLLYHLSIIETFKFKTNNNIFCIKSLKISIISIMQLHLFLRDNYGIEYFLTKRAIQDILENFFSLARHEANENNQLRCQKFRKFFAAFQYSSFLKRKFIPSKRVAIFFSFLLSLFRFKGK